MTQEFTITLDGTEYPVIADGDNITVNGRPFVVEVSDDGGVLVDGIAFDIQLEEDAVVVDKDSLPFQVRGLTQRAAAPPVAHARTAPAQVEAGTGAVLAIMPGKIVRVSVQPGQQVEEGEPVCVLEAMKMENELQCTKAGTVKAVHVTPGSDVEMGAILVEIG